MYFCLLFQDWGVPEIDAFGIKWNMKCKLFCSKGGRDPDSIGDGLLIPWMGIFVFLSPPLPLLTRTVMKLQ